jgi:hypothetical protein
MILWRETFFLSERERERERERGQGSRKLEDFSLFVWDDRLAFQKEI